MDVQARCWQTESGKICSEMASNGILAPIPQIPRVLLTLSNDSFYSYTFEYGFPPPASDDDLPRERARERETRETRERRPVSLQPEWMPRGNVMNQRGTWITDAVLNLRFHRSAEAELRPPAFSHLPSPATLNSIDVYRWLLPLPGGVSPDVSIAEIAISASLDSRGGEAEGGTNKVSPLTQTHLRR